MRRVYLALCIVMVSTLASIASSCNSSMEGYKVFTFTEVAHFTFEYPAHYKKTSAHATIENSTVFIGLRDKVPPKAGTDGYIEIFIEGTGDKYSDATAALEHEIQQFVRPGHLLESSTITVAGISAELTIYSHDPDLIPEGPFADIMKVTRVVYFDYNGLIWKILIDSDEDRAEVAEADFEHILETFEILD